MEPRLKTMYNEDIKKNMMSAFNYKSLMQIPRLEKICINQGVGKAVADKKLIDSAITEMTATTKLMKKLINIKSIPVSPNTPSNGFDETNTSRNR